jgi:hypothetical protein
VKWETWIKMAAEGAVRTRQAAGLMNILKPRARLEIRSNFFSVRVIESWNDIPVKIKMSRSTGLFNRQYKLYRSGQPRRNERS